MRSIRGPQRPAHAHAQHARAALYGRGAQRAANAEAAFAEAQIKLEGASEGAKGAKHAEEAHKLLTHMQAELTRLKKVHTRQ